jgi:hydrogenase nickel incorporation protein HypB
LSTPHAHEITIDVGRTLLAGNTASAAGVRARLQQTGAHAINLMASPGAGKTTLILATAQALAARPAPQPRLGVIEGDLATRIDADRIAAAGLPVVQINTAGGCHLDAPMIAAALDALPIAGLSLILIENVGNLVCPAHFDLGADASVVLGSTPEGDDKPRKYPGIYAVADCVLVTKSDLAPLLDFDLARFTAGVRMVNPHAPVIALSSRTGEGMDGWIEWLLARCVGGGGG